MKMNSWKNKFNVHQREKSLIVLRLLLGLLILATFHLLVTSIWAESINGTYWWKARIESTPSGAEVYCISDSDNRIFLGKTPLKVDIYAQHIKGETGGKGELTHDYKLPVLRQIEGFYCFFEIVYEGKKQNKYAFSGQKIPEDNTSGLVVGMRMGLGGVLMSGISSGNQTDIPNNYKIPENRENSILVNFDGADSNEHKEAQTNREGK